MNKKVKRALKLFLAVLSVSLCMLAPLTVSADMVETTKTLDEAMTYVSSLEGQKVGNGQCVDLIYSYMNYLGFPNTKYIRGNAKYYTTAAIPEGWTRIKGATPRKGDILIYEFGPTGHVAIFDSTDSSYHQNLNKPVVIHYTGTYDIQGAKYWGVIRPYFWSVTITQWSAGTQISGTDAKLGMNLSFTGGTCSKYGISIYDAGKNLLASATRQPFTTSPVSFNVKADCRYTLKPETTYYYQFSATVSGRTHTSSYYSFKTTYDCSVSGHKWTLTSSTAATPSKAGTKKYKCSVCGATKTTSVPKLGAWPGLEVGKTVKTTTSSYKVSGYEGDTPLLTYAAPVKLASPDVIIKGAETFSGHSCKVTAIGSEAFKENKQIKTLRINSGITNVGFSAFYKCPNLTSVIIGKDVKTLGSCAFYGCTSLKTVTMGAGVVDICKRVFRGDTALTAITIPSKTNTIDEEAFYGCKALKSITVKSTILKSSRVGANAFKGTYSKITVTVPASKLSTYKTLFTAKGLSKTAVWKKS